MIHTKRKSRGDPRIAVKVIQSSAEVRGLLKPVILVLGGLRWRVDSTARGDRGAAAVEMELSAPESMTKRLSPELTDAKSGGKA